MKDGLGPDTVFPRRQFENNSGAWRSAAGRSSKEITCLKIQIALRATAVRAAIEAIEDGFGPGAARSRRQFINGASIGGATQKGGAIEVPYRVEDQATPGLGAIAAARKIVEDGFSPTSRPFRVR